MHLILFFFVSPCESDNMAEILKSQRFSNVCFILCIYSVVKTLVVSVVNNTKTIRLSGLEFR